MAIFPYVLFHYILYNDLGYHFTSEGHNDNNPAPTEGKIMLIYGEELETYVVLSEFLL